MGTINQIKSWEVRILGVYKEVAPDTGFEPVTK